MRKITILTVLVIISLHAICQQGKTFLSSSYNRVFTGSYASNNSLITSISAPNGPTKDYDYYMHKRKNNRTVGWSLLGGGLGLAGIGVLLANSETNRGSYDHSSGKGAAVCLVASAAAGLASIPFMIMASINKDKARLLLKNQSTGYGIPSGTGNIIGLTLSRSIGK